MNQVPAYEDIDRRRAQRHAYTETRRSPRQASPQQQPQQPPAAGHRQATAQDRAEAGIPAGYSTKNWDPAEEPIFLLGSVFDANSLGKWIYDWTVYRHGPGTEELELAGELWLSLIALSGKIRQAEDLLLRREKGSKRRLIEDFLDDGDELFDRFRRLLKSCERSMMRVAKRDRETGRVSMGASSGCEFVDCIFGESRGLQETEDLIQSMINWDKRYDATFRKSRKRRTAY